MKASAAIALALVVGCACSFAGPKNNRWSVHRTPGAVSIKNGKGIELLKYQLDPPRGTNAPFESACYFHPVRTPSGRVLTDLSPPDHPHHRGVFLAWVEMHGEVDADFWGWGEHAPKAGRRILNRKISDLAETELGAGFHAVNDWMADQTRVLTEDLKASLHSTAGASVLDLVYTLKSREDLKLSRWAFSGFCVRLPREGKITASGPAGVVTLPNPKHTEPSSDWPASTWYNCDVETPEGLAGVAVIDHPTRPPCGTTIFRPG